MISGGEPVEERSKGTSDLSLWHNRDYLLLLGGQAISRTGSQISQSAAPLLVLLITSGSAFWASVIFGMVLVPNLLFSLVAGALIDRWDRKWVMIVCDLMRALALGSIPVALFVGKLSLLQLCVAAFIEGTGTVFFTVAETASFPSVIEESQMAQAAGQQQAVYNIPYLVGPMFAGIFLSWGRSVPFIVDVCSYAASAASLLSIKRPFQETRSEATSTLLAEIHEGIRWVWRDKIVLLLTLIGPIAMGLDNAWYLLFVVIATRFHTPIYEIGIVAGLAAGGGGIIGSLLADRLEQVLGVAKLIIVTFWIRVLFLALLLLAQNIVVLGIVMFLDGIAMLAEGTALYTTRQLLIPEDLRGRTSGIYSLIAYGGMLLIIWFVGAALQWLGTTATVFILMTMTAATALIVSSNRAIRTIPKGNKAPLEPHEADSEQGEVQ